MLVPPRSAVRPAHTPTASPATSARSRAPRRAHSRVSSTTATITPMPTSLQITTAAADPAVLDLPWDVALEDWPAETIAALPRGISRHTVRFVRLSGRVIAIKEIGETAAYREYELLRDLNRLDVPSEIGRAHV